MEKIYTTSTLLGSVCYKHVTLALLSIVIWLSGFDVAANSKAAASHKNLIFQSTPLISSVSVTSGKSYVVADLAVGVSHYTDRSHTISSVPALLQGATLIRTANNDKASTASNLLSFDLSQGATVYVAYDPRATSLPAWLSTWQKLPDVLGVNDPSISHLELYSKDFPAGRVTLGGNLASPAAGASTNYLVLGKATSSSGNNPPTFTQPDYSFALTDQASPGTLVGSVVATDKDGDAVLYTLTGGNTNSNFTLNATTGDITVAKKLNFHTQASYALTIKATDTQGASAFTTATVAITEGIETPHFTTISWDNAANQPYTVSEAQGEVVNGKLYTFGGFDSKKSCCTPTSRAYVYDPVLNTWTPIAPMPPMNGTEYGGVTHAGFTTDGTDIYFGGGYTSNATGTAQIFGTKEVWKYIVAENRYVRLPDLPITISAGQMEYLNGKLHHIAGTNQARTADLGNHYVLDLDNLSAGWQTLAALPSPRQHAGSAVFEGKIYYIGGQTGHDGKLITSKEVHRYDLGTNTWTKLADLPVPSGARGRGHISSAVTVVGKRILVLGGETVYSTGKTNMVSAYSPQSDSWVNLSGLPAARASGVAAFLNNAIFYTGGSGSTRSSVTFRGKFTEQPAQQQVVSFTLFNADTKQDIQTLASGATLNLATLPTRRLNIRANTNPASVGSVVFALSGTSSMNATESNATYDLMGDNGFWTPTVGNYTLKATPYTGSSGSGTAGIALNVSFSVTDQENTSFASRINAGGTAYTDGQANNWIADDYFTGGTNSSKSFDVSGTTEDELYLKYKYATAGAPFGYNIPVNASGDFTVSLHFLEPYFGAPGGKTTNLTGARVFHVDIEGQRVLSNYDIYSQDGAGKAIVKVFPNVSVTDGMLNILFTSVKENAIISAIEVVSNTSSAAMVQQAHGHQAQDLSLIVYPNPVSSSDKLHVSMTGYTPQEKVTLTIYDLAGRIQQILPYTANQDGAHGTELSISKQLRPGVYIMKAQSDNRETRTKFLVE